MHYITGIQFTVNTQLRLRQSTTGERLIPGTVYQVLKIEKVESGYYYTFIDATRNRIKIPFNSCREADKMISLYRNERIPDYDAFYNNSTDL